MDKTIELTKEHRQVMQGCEEGADVWGYREALLLREVQQYDSELVQILNIPELERLTGRAFDGAGQLPYFGAILTEKGVKYLEGFSGKECEE